MLWVFYVLFFSYHSSATEFILIFSGLLVLITTIPTYLTINFIIPKFLNKKKYKLFGIYTFSTFLLTTILILLLLIISIGYRENTKFNDLPSMGRNYIYITILVYLIVLSLSFFSIWRINTQTTIKNSLLKNQLLVSKYDLKKQELTYLKNQIHPHFLFNSLNTIYGLALKKSKETPEVILKLSDLLDYILYQKNKPVILLVDEIKHIEQYVDLEKIRFNDTLKVDLKEEIKNQNILIAPLILLPFVENVFKHGSIIDGYLNVIINISVIENVLRFTIKNTFKEKNTSSGIGLKNVKERLEILYPNNYDLQIKSSSNWFEVQLEINHLKPKKYV